MSKTVAKDPKIGLYTIFFVRWGDDKKEAEVKKEAEEEKKKVEGEEEDDDEVEPDPNDMSYPVGVKKLMRRCFNPVTGWAYKLLQKTTVPVPFLPYRTL